MARTQQHRHGMLDLNTANRDTLMRMDGVDGVRADMLLRHRPFRSWRDVQQIDGIGRVLTRRIRRQATLGGHPARSRPVGVVLGVVGSLLAISGAVAAAILTSRQRRHQRELEARRQEPARRPSMWPRQNVPPQRQREPLSPNR